MDYIKITPDPLSVDEITKLVTDPTCGAISLFVGTTRDTFEGQSVVRLEYEAYEEMAKKEILKLCKVSREKWSLHHIAVYHRLGLVPVSEASVILAVSAVHRRESLDAVSYLIDELKANVPIWKKEIYDDGSSSWKQNKECLWVKENGNADNSSNKETDATISKRGSDVLESPNSSPIKKIKEEPEEIPEHCETTIEKRVIVKEETDVQERKDISVVDPKYIQILAPKDELMQRIKAFQQHKRQELDVFNVQEFCTMAGTMTSHNSCARTSAVVLRSKDSNSHLKLTRVVNEWGPQTVGKDPGSVNSIKQGSGINSSNGSSREGSVERNNLSSNITSTEIPCTMADTHESVRESLPPGLDERLHNLENYVKIKPNGPVPHDVYARLKALEDRVLRLEGISPEYFGDKKIKILDDVKKKEIKSMEGDLTLDDIDRRIYELKMRLKERQLKHAF